MQKTVNVIAAKTEKLDVHIIADRGTSTEEHYLVEYLVKSRFPPISKQM